VEIDVALYIQGEDHTSPLLVTVENKTRNASDFLWTFDGGEPETSTKREPGTIKFTSPGEHNITLEAWNDGDKSVKVYTVRVDNNVKLDFNAEVDINNYAPATFNITNLSEGATFYKWTFEGGEPASFKGENPPAVIFANEGTYTITLTAENGSASFTSKQEIIVKESLDALFNIVPSFEDEDDMEAPLRATFNTRLKGTESLQWECTGAIIANPTMEEASIYFPKEGKYTVYLNVSNGKNTKRISQDITVKANTNLRTHENIRFGINTAQNTIGCYYSTKLRKSFTSSQLTDEIGNMIDIVFVGLNTNFRYNFFISPDKLSETPLTEIMNAQTTKFINRQELGAINLSTQEFISMTTDAVLKDLAISSALYGDEYFSAAPIPRVILFQTADGRKGAILVKEIVSKDATGSYIVADIKVQKND